LDFTEPTPSAILPPLPQSTGLEVRTVASPLSLEKNKEQKNIPPPEPYLKRYVCILVYWRTLPLNELREEEPSLNP
jgi:hypothetical protein